VNIGLIGYGKMGRLLETVSGSRGHRVVTVLDPVNRPGERYDPSKADVLLEFTGPETAAENITATAGAGMAVVSGSTGWYHKLPEVAAAVEAGGGALLWSANFSLGVNIFFRLCSYAAALVDPFEEYDVGGLEAHHNKKADSPSGTAKILMERVLSAMTRKTKVLWERDGDRPEKAAVHFSSLRVGSLPGVHSLVFDSPADTIEITHTARGREGFALGAVIAAEWLAGSPAPDGSGGAGPGRRRGVFTMNDVLKDILP
jgi:4-hydroxy-tetrahydrodipicolinate reductase